MQRIQWHPILMEAWISFHVGASQYHVVDSNGDLNCSGLMMHIRTSVFPGNGWGYRNSDDQDYDRYQAINYSDVANGLGPCGISPSNQKIRFIKPSLQRW